MGGALRVPNAVRHWGVNQLLARVTATSARVGALPQVVHCKTQILAGPPGCERSPVPPLDPDAGPLRSGGLGYRRQREQRFATVCCLFENSQKVGNPGKTWGEWFFLRRICPTKAGAQLQPRIPLGVGDGSLLLHRGSRTGGSGRSAIIVPVCAAPSAATTTASTSISSTTSGR